MKIEPEFQIFVGSEKILTSAGYPKNVLTSIYRKIDELGYNIKNSLVLYKWLLFGEDGKCVWSHERDKNMQLISIDTFLNMKKRPNSGLFKEFYVKVTLPQINPVLTYGVYLGYTNVNLHPKISVHPAPFNACIFSSDGKVDMGFTLCHSELNEITQDEFFEMKTGKIEK